MTASPRTVAPSPRREVRSGDLARGALAGAVLMSLVVGVPVLLVLIGRGTVPTAVPTWSELIGSLTRPDDGRLFFAVLALIAWLGWAAFAVSVAVEAVAAVRGLRAPSIPLLGITQRAAAILVAAVTLAISAPSVSGGPADATVASAPASARTEPRHVADLSPARTSHPAESKPVSPADDGLPVVVVERGDSLWALAERYLGDGERYPEIFRLNVDRRQPDGHRLTDSHWINPGWQLRLPSDATGIAEQDRAAPGTTNGATQVTVRPGESLWSIAAAHLGDGDRYPEIVRLNEGVRQADGRSLTDPSLIRPGWVLKLPSDVDDPSTSAVQPDAPATQPDAQPDATAEPGPSGSAAPSLAPAVRMPRPDAVPGVVPQAAVQPDGSSIEAEPGPAPAHSPERVAAAGDGRATPEVTPSGGAAGANATEVSSSADGGGETQGLYLGLTALAAAGVIGELVRRRRLQHRLRRTGERITRPAEDSPASIAERQWHAAPTPLSLGQIRTALDHLAEACFTTGRDLPRVGAVEVAPERLTLLLVEEDAAPVAPFAATASPRTWSAPTAALAALEPLDGDGRPEPYPALVALGHTNRSTLLVNLEAAGTLRIVGDDDPVSGVLRAAVAELATSELSGRIGLTTDAEFSALARACSPARLQAGVTSVPAHQLRDRASSAGAALASHGFDDTLQARSDREAPDLWLPVIYLTDAADSGRCVPWSGSCVITREDHPDGWRVVVAEDHARLDPIGLEFTPSSLTDEGLAHITELLGAATPSRWPSSSGPVVSAQDEALGALAALPEPPRGTVVPEPGQEPALRINVLGPLRFENIPTDQVLSDRQAELLVYMALNPDCTGLEIDDALWPGKRTEGQPRWGLAYRTRRVVLSRNLPQAGRHDELRLSPDVTCDWHEFQRLAQIGLAKGAAGVPELRDALAIVRGRPLAGVPSAAYGWADHEVDRMISAIGDVAHTLGRLLVESGDIRDALSVAVLGLEVDMCSERLKDDAVAAALAQGDVAKAHRIQARHDEFLATLDDELV